MFWDIIIIAGIFWIIMSFFVFMQTVQVNNIYKVLDPIGKVYSGMDAGFMRTRYIAFAAVDSGGKVLDARMLKASRIITLAKTLPLESIIGKNIRTLDANAMDLDKRQTLALTNLTKNFVKRSSGGK